MNKFHQIPTDTFVPISHDNSYLFNHYNKVANFLAFNLEKNYKNILAKPVQNGYAFDWFSNYPNLVNNAEKSKNEAEADLIKYWNFIDVINFKITQLENSNDDNNKNWAELLKKVFDHQNNFIFSNGTDICIVWGWKFDNNQNYKPNIVSKPDIEKVFVDWESTSGGEVNNATLDYNSVEESAINEEPIAPDNTNDPLPKTSFLEFLKWFASHYWYLLWLLITIIALIFFIKSLSF